MNSTRINPLFRLSASICFWLLTLLLLLGLDLQAQTIYFHYDNAGNRTERSLSATPTPSARLREADSTKVEEVIDEEYQTILYPNASDGLFFISMGQNNEPVELYIYDIRGRVVYQDAFEQSQFQFDLTDQPTGVYVVKWRNHERSFTEKVLKR